MISIPKIQEILARVKSDTDISELHGNNETPYYNPFLLLILGYETKISILTSNVEKYAKKVVTLRSSIKEALSNQMSLEEELNNNIQELLDSKEEVLNKADEPYDDIILQDLQSHIMELKARNEFLIQRTEEFTNEIKNKEKELADNKEKYDSLFHYDKNEINQKTIDTKVLTEQNKELEKRLAELESKNLKLKNQKICIEEEVFEKRREKRIKKMEFKSKEKKYQEKEEKLKQKREELEERYKALQKQSDQQWTGIQEALSELHDKKMIVERLKNDHKKQKEKIDYLSTTKDQLLKAINDIENEVNELKDETKEVENEKNIKNERVERLNEQKKYLEEEKEKYTEKFKTEMEKLEKYHEEQMEHLKKDFDNKRQSKELEILNLESELEKLQLEYKLEFNEYNIKRESIESTANPEEQNELINRLNNQYLELESEYRDLLEGIANKDNSFDSKEDEETEKTDINSLALENQNLYRQLKELESQEKELQNDLEKETKTIELERNIMYNEGQNDKLMSFTNKKKLEEYSKELKNLLDKENILQQDINKLNGEISVKERDLQDKINSKKETYENDLQSNNKLITTMKRRLNEADLDN